MSQASSWIVHEPDDSGPRRRHHGAMLGLSVCVILLSLILTTNDNQRVAFIGLPQFPLPDTCQSRVWLRMDCPGCGLTRSFIHFFHGRWQDSVHLHRLGWLLALLTALQIPYRLLALSRPYLLPHGEVFSWTLGVGLCVLLVVNWVLKLAGV